MVPVSPRGRLGLPASWRETSKSERGVEFSVTDIIIIGAGVSGCAIARELSRRKADILVVEREEDV